MKREHIIMLLIFVVVLGVLGAGYQFYFKARAEQYAQNIAQRERLKNRLSELEASFKGIRPTALITEWRGAVQPWADALERRAEYFHLDEITVDPVPADKMPKFYYAEEFQKRVDRLREYAFTRNPPCQVPDQLFGYFGAPLPSTMVNRSVKADEVIQALERFDRGAALLRMFIDAKATSITALEIWPPRTEFDGLLEMHTVGVAFTVQPKDLVELLEDFSRNERFVSVNAISVQNPYIITWWEPQFQVQMLVTQAKYNAPKPSEQAAATVAAAAPTGQARSLEEFYREQFGARRQQQQTSAFSRWWRQFRQRYLF